MLFRWDVECWRPASPLIRGDVARDEGEVKKMK